MDWFGGAFLICVTILSVKTIPISTIVPTAMAIPDSATILASTSKYRIAIKHIKTATGSDPATNNDDLKLSNIRITTIIVIRISKPNASSKVPKVSLIKSVLS